MFQISDGVLTKYTGSDNSVVIPKKVKAIADEVFAGCGTLEKVSFSNSVDKIGKKAFYKCENLRRIILPDGLTEIGDSAFYGCRSLKVVEIPDSVKRIGYRAFYNCSDIEHVELYGGIDSIGEEAFAYCSSLIAVSIPESVTKIEKKAFDHCTGLKSVAMPKSLFSFYSFDLASAFDDIFTNCGIINSPYNTIKYTHMVEGKKEDNSYFAVPVIFEDNSNKPVYWSSDLIGKELWQIITRLFLDNKISSINHNDSFQRERVISLAHKLLRIWELIVFEDMAYPINLSYQATFFLSSLVLNHKNESYEVFDAYIDKLLQCPEERILVCCAPLEGHSSREPVSFELDNEWQNYLKKSEHINSFSDYLKARNNSHYDWWPQYLKERSKKNEENSKTYNAWLSEAEEEGYFCDDV